MTKAGPYELLEPVGAGSAGTVYKARRGEEIFALKVLQSPPPTLWLEHLKALAQCDSPHLCRFLETGRSEDQSCYLVYQFLEGGDLESARARFDDGRTPLRTALRWTIDALKGLGAMHDAGFLHGDIKPSNLMLDGQGRAVVCDYTTLTPLRGALALDLRNGTPEYLPAGDELLRSPRRDLYALGMTLAGLLIGKLPDSPEAAVPSLVDPLLPAAVDDLVERALGLEEPFQTASEMRRAVEALLTAPDPGAAAKTLSPPTRRVQWTARDSAPPLWPWFAALLMLPLGLWARERYQPPPLPAPVSTAFWSGLGVAPGVYRQQLVWQVLILGRPVLGFADSDPVAGGETARERAEWCAAVLEEAHFQKRQLKFAYRREYEDSCDVYLVGQDLPDKFLFRVGPAECKLFDRKGPFVARVWTALIADTAELARPGSRGGEKGPAALLLQPWQRRFETLAGPEGGLDQPARVALWLKALDGLDGDARKNLLQSYEELPEPPKESSKKNEAKTK